MPAGDDSDEIEFCRDRGVGAGRFDEEIGFIREVERERK